MLDISSIYQDLFAVNNSSIPLDLLRFCSRYLLNTYSILSRSIELRYIYIYLSIYLKFDPVLFKLKYFDLSFSSLDPNTFFSPKPFSHSKSQPNPNLNPLVSVLNLFLFSLFMHFMHFRPRFSFFGKIFGYLNYL